MRYLAQLSHPIVYQYGTILYILAI